MSAHLPRIAFLGSDAIALPMLQWLRNEGARLCELALIYAQPDRRQGRGKKLQPNPVAAFAREQGIPLYQPEKPGPEDAARLHNEGITLALVMAYGHILKQDLLDAPTFGCLNFHASVLPKLRGASPIETAVATGESETGVSLMRIIRRMDAGAVAAVERVPISPATTGGSLRQALATACVPLLSQNLPAALSGSLQFTEQDEAAATYCRKLEKADGALDFQAPATVLAARINGLDPWPGCYAEHHEQRLKLRQAFALPGNASAPPGTVLDIKAEGIRLACGQGTLQVAQWQRPGGKMLPAQDFARGYQLAVGEQLTSTPMPALLKSQ